MKPRLEEADLGGNSRRRGEVVEGAGGFADTGQDPLEYPDLGARSAGLRFEVLAAAGQDRLGVCDQARRQVGDQVAHRPVFGLPPGGGLEREVEAEGVGMGARLGGQGAVAVFRAHRERAGLKAEVRQCCGRREGEAEQRQGEGAARNHLALPFFLP